VGSRAVSEETINGRLSVSERYVAVIDIGKTNKKVHIYSSSLELVDARSTTLESVERDGIPWIDSEKLEEWILDTLSAFSSRYDIATLAVATHGATFACIDENGDLSIPIVDYTYEPGEDFHRRFYELAGDPVELQQSTATLELGALINIAQGILFLQEHAPEQFRKTRHVLFYPQYISYRLTGKVSADFTYAGCHTYLYDFESRDYSSVADALGVRSLLPPDVRVPHEVLDRIDPAVAGRTGLSPDTVVTLGIHDSNASLLPYLIKKPGEDFILNSTGTWCVAMHPEDEVRFHESELGKSVFYNLCAFGTPVKTSILLGGLEFETYTNIFKQRFGMEEFPEFDPDLYRSIIKDCEEFILPAVVRGTGQFPESPARVVDHGETFMLEELSSGDRVPEFFSNAKRAYAVLNLSLAVQTVVALERVGLRSGVTVYTEGGFRNNEDYNLLLAALVPDASFFLSGMPEATSFGAALTGLSAWQQKELADLGEYFEIEQESVRSVELPGIEAYQAAFMVRLGAPE
jgi:sugar (pentulose or hexulose) kinase